MMIEMLHTVSALTGLVLLTAGILALKRHMRNLMYQ